MNQRFEDTYDKATNAICGMAKDYRLMDERNRLLNIRVREQTDEITELRLKLDKPIAPTDCANCPHQYPEFKQHKFSLSSLEDVRLIEHEESDINLAVDMELNKFFDAFPHASKAPRLYDSYFDVLMWRWTYNTALIRPIL